MEKYRPVYLDDVVGNTETVERLKIIAKDGNMPHFIISGMPGIGKTTSILCLARQLLGDAYKEAVLELNASDERGIPPDLPLPFLPSFSQHRTSLQTLEHALTPSLLFSKKIKQASTSSATALKPLPKKK